MPYFDAESLRPAIRAILAGADQSQITARQVRKMLVQNDSSLDVKVLDDHKEEINHITKSVFEALTALSPSPSPSPSPPPKPSSSSKPHSNSHHSFPQHQPSASTSTSTSAASSSEPKSSSSKPHKVKSEPTNQTLTDAEYAQSLSLSLNSHSTRPSSSKTKSSSSKDEKKRKRDRVQSSPTVDSDSDAGGEQKKKKKSKKVKKVKSEGGEGEEGGEKKVRGGAFNKEMGLSEALQAVVGGDRMSRPQTVKKIWEYVKERGLQDASDKRFIICDETLQAVFKVPKVHMFTMNKLLSKHIYPLDE